MSVIYVITDTNKKLFLKRNADSTFTSTAMFSEATDFETSKKANNVLKNMPNTLKVNKSWKVQEIYYEDPVKEPVKKSEKVDIVKKEEITSDKDEDEIKVIDFDNFIDSLRKVTVQIKEVSEKKEWLYSELSKTDCEIDVVMHYLENKNFSASLGYKLAYLQKLMRSYRRMIKNELEFIEYFNTQTCAHLASGRTLQIVDKLVNDWKYEPKYLQDLYYENKIDEVIQRYEQLVNHE